MFYNFCIATVSCWVLGGIAMEEKKKKEELVKMIEKVNNPSHLSMIYGFVRRICLEEKKERM